MKIVTGNKRRKKNIIVLVLDRFKFNFNHNIGNICTYYYYNGDVTQKVILHYLSSL